MDIPDVMLRDKEFKRSTIELFAFLKVNPEAINMTLRELASHLNQSYATVDLNLAILDKKGWIQTRRQKAVTREIVEA